MKIKVLPALFLSFSVIGACVSVQAGQQNEATDIKLVINKQNVSWDGAYPIVEDGSTLVPIRVVTESLKGNVDWDSKTKTITIKKGNNEIVLTIDTLQYSINNNDDTLSVAPKLINDKTYIPLRSVATALDTEVSWDDKTRTIYIEDTKNTNNEIVDKNFIPQAETNYIELDESLQAYDLKIYTKNKGVVEVESELPSNSVYSYFGTKNGQKTIFKNPLFEWIENKDDYSILRIYYSAYPLDTSIKLFYKEQKGTPNFTEVKISMKTMFDKQNRKIENVINNQFNYNTHEDIYLTIGETIYAQVDSPTGEFSPAWWAVSKNFNPWEDENRNLFNIDIDYLEDEKKQFFVIKGNNLGTSNLSFSFNDAKSLKNISVNIVSNGVRNAMLKNEINDNSSRLKQPFNFVSSPMAERQIYYMTVGETLPLELKAKKDADFNCLFSSEVIDFYLPEPKKESSSDIYHCTVTATALGEGYIGLQYNGAEQMEFITIKVVPKEVKDYYDNIIK